MKIGERIITRKCKAFQICLPRQNKNVINCPAENGAVVCDECVALKSDHEEADTGMFCMLNRQ